MTSSIDATLVFLSNTDVMPLLIIGLAVVSLLTGRIVRCSPHALFVWSSLCIVSAFIVTLLPHSHMPTPINGISFSPLSHVGFQILLPALLAISVMISTKNIDNERKIDSLLLLFISFLGGMTVMASTNWMMFFIGIQCLTLPIFGLLMLDTSRQVSVASSVRYLVLSSIAMACMLFGIALLYAQTGSLDFFSQTKILEGLKPDSLGLAILGLSLVFVGLSFKLSLVPFHFWAPEVYLGAPFFVLAYLVVIAKAVVVFFILKNAWLIFGLNNTLIITMLSVIAILSMWLGNGLMVIEHNLYRFLAFLSIGHLGFLLVPLLSNHELGTTAIVVDLSAFSLALILVLATLKVLPQPQASLTIDDLRGLAHKNPWSALVLAVGLASLAGLPLTAGFIAKYTIFMSGALSEQWLLVINMAFCSVCSLLALLRIIIALYKNPEARPQKLATPLLNKFLLIGALALLVLGIAPEVWLVWVKSALSTDAQPITISRLFVQ
jgi:NADH-quinone oxidoreductase subunit N